MNRVVVCLAFAVLMLAPQALAQSGTGRRVDFPLTQFDDTLFTAVDGAFRVREDPDGHVWYTTEGGLVHVDPYNRTRELFTKFEGLPSSYSLGLDIEGDEVYVGTDLGLAIVHRSTGKVDAYTPANSPILDGIVYDVVRVGEELWVATRFGGVGTWDPSLGSITNDAAWTWKNTSTTPDYPQGVRRLVVTPGAIWAATEGDGAWRFDRASRTWNVTLYADGLADTSVFAVAERGTTTWFGSPKGLASRDASGSWRYYNTSNSGIPSNRVLDVDVIATTAGTTEVFASTPRGVWQLNPETGANFTRTQSYGILGSYVFDNEPAPRGWLFATGRGISHYLDGTWRYYATGPSSGASWGPLSFGFTSASVGDQNGYVWFGSSRGLSAYKLPVGETRGAWQNFGEWQNYPGSVVNWIDTQGNITWFGTNAGTYGFEHETGRWISKVSTGSRNLVYSVDAAGEELWIALFGDGLLMENRTTGIVRSWTFETLTNPIPDQYITDVRVDGDIVWLGASAGVIKMDRASGAFLDTINRDDGVPGGGVVFRVLPEGPTVWVATKNGGVAKLDVASGKVGRVWNATTEPGFPGGEVRSLYREGGRLWVGTTEGLARIDVTTGQFRAWRQSNSALVQDFVNGITSAEGTLYLATLSGVQRMDIATGEFLPMWDGPGVVRGAVSGEGETAGATRVNVRIDNPRDGTAVTGSTEIRGSALVFGTPVDKVEVRIGEGAWQTASGTESWTYAWDTTALPPNEPVTITVRASAGAIVGQSEILVTPVAPPTVPLSAEEIAPGDAFANRPLQMGARVEGDEPLTASLYYKPAGTSSYTRLPLARQGGLFLAQIPARDMREGEMRYYIEAQSGLLTTTAAGDAAEPTTLTVAPAPRLAVAVEAPTLVEATAGEEARFALNVTNAGSEPATFRLSASGLRAAWVSVPPDDLELAPGETRTVTARLNVPAAAFADNTTIAFEARDSQGVADPAQASVPVRILAAQAQPTAPTGPAPRDGIPGAPPVAVLALALALALVLRRRSS